MTGMYCTYPDLVSSPPYFMNTFFIAFAKVNHLKLNGNSTHPHTLHPTHAIQITRALPGITTITKTSKTASCRSPLGAAGGLCWPKTTLPTQPCMHMCACKFLLGDLHLHTKNIWVCIVLKWRQIEKKNTKHKLWFHVEAGKPALF